MTSPPPDLLAVLTDVHGAFVEGYTDADVDAVLGVLSAASGVRLVVAWEYVDLFGAGGSSDLGVDRDGQLWNLAPQLYAHLVGEAACRELLDEVLTRGAAALAGSPGTPLELDWLPGTEVVETAHLTRFGHNYAAEDRR